MTQNTPEELNQPYLDALATVIARLNATYIGKRMRISMPNGEIPSKRCTIVTFYSADGNKRSNSRDTKIPIKTFSTVEDLDIVVQFDDERGNLRTIPLTTFFAANDIKTLM